MTLKKREKVLLFATGSLVVVWLGVFLSGGVSNPFQSLYADRSELAEKVRQTKRQVEDSKEAKALLERWERRALPSDPHAAKSVYEHWIYDLATSAGIRCHVKPSADRPYRDIYRSLAFTLQGRGSLDELTELIHDFYAAGHLHQIRRLTLKPHEGSRDFDVTMLVEALSLPGADRATELADMPAEQDDDLGAWRETVLERDLFRPYEPPRPVVVNNTPPPPSFDHAQHTYVTGIVAVDGTPQVWIQVRTKGKNFRLHEGDRFEIGPLQGSVVRIGSREVVLDLGDERLLAFQGENLRDAVPLME